MKEYILKEGVKYEDMYYIIRKAEYLNNPKYTFICMSNYLRINLKHLSLADAKELSSKFFEVQDKTSEEFTELLTVKVPKGEKINKLVGEIIINPEIFTKKSK